MKRIAYIVLVGVLMACVGSQGLLNERAGVQGCSPTVVERDDADAHGGCTHRLQLGGVYAQPQGRTEGLHGRG